LGYACFSFPLFIFYSYTVIGTPMIDKQHPLSRHQEEHGDIEAN